ncbi:MAG TPA: adenine glycosylase [Coriobacteriia bacterium]|nr:adenine glycosylase [Coriobacteriia bacterium]
MKREDLRAPVSACDIGAFVTRIAAEGKRLYRDFPWRRTHDPYLILVSEVMLQQTQVARVVPYFDRWATEFPDLEALAAAPLEAVLRQWQGLGYNRRAIALKRAAEDLVVRADASGAVAAQLPRETTELVALPGIGPATAAGIRAFAFGEPSVYLETNVRAVFLHDFFPDAEGVPDRVLLPIVEAAAVGAQGQGIGARDWNYALLDYGAWLKSSVPNPSRRSAHHTRQSTFEGSKRQKRARLLRLVMERPGHDSDAYAVALGEAEFAAGRGEPSAGEILGLLEELAREGFVVREDGGWRIPQ